MRNHQNIIFIDSKGVSHNARVESFREHRDGDQKLIHHEPLVTLNYNAPPTGEPKTLIDVPHMSHPHRQENNPELPSYPLHVWKYEHEEHLEVPLDHPLHDHPYEEPKKDDQGTVIPKHRPVYEGHIAAHRAAKAITPPANTIITPLERITGVKDGGPLKAGATSQDYIPLGHPAHPETIHFDFQCASCGVPVRRVASHQGGKQWEQKIVRVVDLSDSERLALGRNTGTLETGEWIEHVCNPETAKAYAESLKQPKTPPVVELTPSEKLAAGNNLEIATDKPITPDNVNGPIEVVEPDVISELQKAPPPPTERPSVTEGDEQK